MKGIAGGVRHDRRSRRGQRSGSAQAGAEKVETFFRTCGGARRLDNDDDGGGKRGSGGMRHGR